MHQIGRDLAIAEGIETALSVMQITGVPAVAALSAAGMRSFRWPQHIRKLWIAADNDESGLQAARALLKRALDAGLKAEIKVPARACNDFNDLLLR
jgi:putative DNA primase/helicase